MRVFRPIVQPLVLSMFYALHDLLFGRFVTLEFVGNNHSWHKALFFEQFAKESLGRFRIPMPLQQYFQHSPLCIHCSPQIILPFLDRHYYLIEMPFVSDEGAFASKLIGIPLSELLAPFPNRFIGDLNAPIEHHFLNVSVAQGKGVVEPNAVANDFTRESMTGIHG